MKMSRRDLVVSAPAVGLVSILAASEGNALAGEAVDSQLYRVETPATILAAARGIMKEDWVGVLVTIDESGMPRARPVGVGEAAEDGSFWLATRRGSRKTRQIAANPKAALHFGFDDIPNGNENSFYATFTGLASVHTEPGLITKYGPSERYRKNWPNYPDDLALIRFKPSRLEVMGKGIKPSIEHWQPQGITLPLPA